MKHVISVLCVLAVLLCMAPFVSPNGEGEAVSAAARTETGPFIVDAGHGGEDGGAVSADGTQESGINLAIALRLEDILAAVPPPSCCAGRISPCTTRRPVP